MIHGMDPVQSVVTIVSIVLILQNSVWLVSTTTTTTDTATTTTETAIDTTTINADVDNGTFSTGTLAANGTETNSTDAGGSNSTANGATNGTASGNGTGGTTERMTTDASFNITANMTRSGNVNGVSSVTAAPAKKIGGVKLVVIIGLSAGFGFGILTCIFVLLIWNCCCNKLCGDGAAQIMPIDFRGADTVKDSDDS